MNSMATRSVRFDAETEQALQRLTRVTGLSISEILKRGVFAYQAVALEQAPRKPWDIYAALELGAGGSAQGAAADRGTARGQEKRP